MMNHLVASRVAAVCREGRRRTFDWLQANHGATLLEYALLLAIVTGAVLIGAQVFAGSAGQHLERPVEAVMAGSHVAPQAVAGTAPSWAVWLLPSQAIILVALLILCLMLRRQRHDPDRVRKTLAALAGKQPDHVFSKRQQIFQLFLSNVSDLINSQVLVRHLMSQQLTTVSPTKSREDVAQLMEEKRLRHLLVCTPQKELLGVISDRDVIGSKGKTAEDIMTVDPYRVDPDSLVNPAITLMINKRINSLPVVKDGKLEGLLTSTDLMVALQCALQALYTVAGDFESEHEEPASALHAATHRTDRSPLEAGV